ncbi:hypothetical protein BTN49_1655 [Candidatus Enterovibrio escicola]|uniref:Uncharacterized protein n=1 Tax=Candidatus Enterovibrio escicola TaxID=1927127 RepID=A0A2A5T3G1_9GAMM|nr:hypothetical protein BTN49_1655 [Candidatus Enterovibrio escacola]
MTHDRYVFPKKAENEGGILYPNDPKIHFPSKIDWFYHKNIVL